MKLEFIRDEEGNRVGYKLIPETLDEAKDLNFVRNYSFYSRFRYNGRSTNKNFPNEAGDLKWITENEYNRRKEQGGDI